MSGFNKEKFANLLNEAKGDRSLNEFARVSGISSAHVSRLMRSLLDVPPEPATIRKFAEAAHNGVTYESFLEAAGHITAEVLNKMERLEGLKKLQAEYSEAEENLKYTTRLVEDSEKEVADAKAELESLENLQKAGAEHISSLVKVPVLGYIAAGQPILAMEHIIDWEYVINPGTKEGDLFSLVVKGDSMIGSRIFEGDKVLVRVQQEVEAGEIAVVNVDGESATLKRVKRIDGKVLLLADNPKYEPILVNSECARICGKVIQVIFDPNKKF